MDYKLPLPLLRQLEFVIDHVKESHSNQEYSSRVTKYIYTEEQVDKAVVLQEFFFENGFYLSLPETCGMWNLYCKDASLNFIDVPNSLDNAFDSFSDLCENMKNNQDNLQEILLNRNYVN